MDPDTDTARGQVRWHVTLDWAPGGEEFLSKNISQCERERPWWVGSDSTDGHSQEALGRPRDLRNHFYSYIPLYLLADLEPTKMSPKGWFCHNCGMINPQSFLWHRICRSERCKVGSPVCRFTGGLIERQVIVG